MELEEKLELLNKNSSVGDVQEYINEMIELRGFGDETPQDVLLFLTEELGELAKAIRKTANMKMDVSKSKGYDVEEEVADMFSYIMAMCRVLDINLVEAFKNKEKQNFKREWK